MFRLIFTLAVFITSLSGFAQKKYTIVIHGGAGYMEPTMPAELKKRYTETLDSALHIGAVVLENDGNALDAVEKQLPLNPLKGT